VYVFTLRYDRFPLKPKHVAGNGINTVVIDGLCFVIAVHAPRPDIPRQDVMVVFISVVNFVTD
jgi:hypothetical protein